MIDFGLGVSLVALRPEWGEQLREWRNHPSIRRWCRQVGLISPIDQKKWIEAQNADPTIRMFGVLDQSGALCGVCGLTSIDLVSRRAEFSLYVGKNFHGHGHGKRALKTLCLFGFEELGLNLVWGESFHGNKAIEMFKDVGFVYEGTRRDFYFKDGAFLDAHLYSVKRHELRI